MKRLIAIAVVAAALTPLSAAAQERMSDARFLSANRCLAYADIGSLQGDPVDFTGLREAVTVGNRERTITSQARQNTRAIQARAVSYNADELRERRDAACASFVEIGLVQLGGSGNS